MANLEKRIGHKTTGFLISSFRMVMMIMAVMILQIMNVFFLTSSFLTILASTARRAGISAGMKMARPVVRYHQSLVVVMMMMMMVMEMMITSLW